MPARPAARRATSAEFFDVVRRSLPRCRGNGSGNSLPKESARLQGVIPYRLAPGAAVRIDQPPLTVEVLGATHALQPSGNRIGVVG